MQPASGRSTAVLHPCSLTECCCRRAAETLIILAQLNQPVPVGVPCGWCRSALILRQKVAKATWWPGSASTGIFISKGSNKLQYTQSLRTSAVSGPRPWTSRKAILQPYKEPPKSAFVSGGGKGMKKNINYSLKRCLDIYIYTDIIYRESYYHFSHQDLQQKCSPTPVPSESARTHGLDEGQNLGLGGSSQFLVDNHGMIFGENKSHKNALDFCGKGREILQSHGWFGVASG